MSVVIRKGNICNLAALADVLRFHGCNVSESLLLGAMGGINYKFGFSEVQRNDISNSLPYFKSFDVTGSFDELQMICFLLGGTLTKEELETEEESLKKIIEELNENRPVIIFLDSFFLSSNPNYKKIHSGHSVIVDQIDLKNKKVSIGDNYVTTLAGDTFKGEVALEEFLEAIDLSQTRSTSKYAIWHLKFENIEVKRSLAPLMSHIEQLLKHKMFNKDLKHMQIEYLNQFSNYLSNSVQLNEDSLLIWAAGMEHLITRMNIVKNSFIVYLDFVQWIENNYCEYSNRDLSKTVEELAENWKVVYNLLLKFNFTKRVDVLEKVCSRIMKIEHLELSLIEQ